MTSFWKQLPYMAQIGIVALVIVLLAVGTYFPVLQPLEKENEKDALTLKTKQAEIAQLAPYREKLAELNAQTAALKAQMEAQKKVVPEEKDVPSLITQVERESLAAGVEVRRYTPRPVARKEYYTEVPFDVDVDGPYYSVVGFYDRLQKLERIVNVSGLTMGALKGGGKTGMKRGYAWSPKETVGANCVLTTFYSNPKDVAAPAAAKGKKVKP
jgi:type IV pilus assembly protein PilO